MLSGRYPSDEFAELRPRVTWDRVNDTLAGTRRRQARGDRQRRHDSRPRPLWRLPRRRRPARRASASWTRRWCSRSQVGETFTLGASTWRIEEITHDRVLVSPAPGEPGKMPFWHGDQAGRPVELGFAIGKLVRELRALPRAAAVDRLVRAARSRRDGRREPAALPRRPGRRRRRAGRPHDRHRALPRRARRLARVPAVAARQPHPRAVGDGRDRADPQPTGIDVEVMWGDEGFVVRFPDVETPPDPTLLLPDVEEVEGAGASAARLDVALRRALSRDRRAGAAPAAPAAGHADAAVAAAQARRRSARRRIAVRLVPGPARNLSRSAARPLRHAGARRHAAQDLARARSACRRSTRRSRRRSPRRCSSATSPTTSTTATRRWPSGGRRRCRSIRRSSASCSATPNCASCSTPRRWTAIERQLQHLDAKYKVRTVDGVARPADSHRRPDAAGARGAQRRCPTRPRR